MHTVVERRQVNLERLQETMQRGEREFFPALRAAPGFVGFYLVADEANHVNTAVVVWESKAQADTFQAEYGAWLQTLDELGHTLLSDNRGETVVSLEPER
jgi:heme-degrading monooxygenase HmoA